MEVPFTVAEIDEACKQTCARNGLSDAYIRPIAWRGSEMIGVSAQNTTTHVSIAVWDWPSYFAPEERAKGIRLTWAKYKRPSPETEPVHAKAAGLYMICTISKHAAEKDGYADAMMLDYRGYVAEATGANAFFVRDGAIHTPTPDCFLNGLTRQSVIKIAREKGIEVIERHIKPEELSTFSECFITGSAAEVTPVGEIGEYRFKPGQISLGLAEDYSRMVRRQRRPSLRMETPHALQVRDQQRQGRRVPREVQGAERRGHVLHRGLFRQGVGEERDRVLQEERPRRRD
jgi:branched-chain amino acid aminotransferase